MEVEVFCPYCGQPLTLSVDETGGHQQTYVEDCAVCCQPIEVRARVDVEEFEVNVRRQDD